MEFDKLICWVDAEMQEKITKEFFNSEIILVQTFSDFAKSITNYSLNLISASNFNDFDSSGLIYEVIDFFRTKTNLKFHVFLFTEKDDSGLSSGELAKEPNVISHLIFSGYNGTIQARIDAGL
jgi:hypothetical protein